MPDFQSSTLANSDFHLVVFTRDGNIIHARDATFALVKHNIKLKMEIAAPDRLRPNRKRARAASDTRTVRQLVAELCRASRKTPRQPIETWRASWRANARRHDGVWIGQPPSRTEPGVLVGLPVCNLGTEPWDDAAAKLELQAIVDTAVDGIITIDDRGMIEAFNPAAEKLFGYRKADIVGKPVSTLMPDPYRTEHDGYMHHYLQTGEKRIIGIGREVIGRRRNGSTFPMFLSVGEHRTAGRPKFTGIVHDITDRKRAESQVLLVSERVQQRLGHDLHDGIGQVLTGAALYARAIETEFGRHNPDMSGKLNHLVGIISEAVNQTRNLSRGLQPLAHIADYKIAMNSLQSQLNGMLADRLDVHAEELPPIAHLLHANNLFRIAQEALTNALRHSSAEHIAIRSESHDRWVRLSIKDDGKGFVRRAHNGLGLHIMDYRARLMGGQLQVESKPRRGTTITCNVDCGIITKEMGELQR